MKTRNFLLSGILGIALAGFVLTGCHKASTNPDTDYAAAQDEANGQMAANDSKSVSDAAISTTSHGPMHSPITFATYYTTNCTITWATDSVSSGVNSVTIDFGSTPQYCKDYRYRSGAIVVSWPSKANFLWWQAYLDSNTTVTETFKNYAIGKTTGTMYGVAGTRTWTNEGVDVTLGLYDSWKFTANLTITNPSGKIFTWTSNRTNTLTKSGSYWYYSITGSATGVTETGVTYNINITSPLFVSAYPWWDTSDGGCAYIEGGSITITRSSSTNTLTVNFGNVGSCDNQAVATLNGNNYNITMW